MHTITTGYLNDRPPRTRTPPHIEAHRGAYDKVGGPLYTAIRASVLSRRREVAHQPQHGDIALPDQRASVRGADQVGVLDVAERFGRPEAV